MIQVSENYRIDADSRCFTIYRKTKVKGKIVWKSEFYFTSLEHVFQKLINLSVAKGIDAGSWKAVAKEVSETKKLIKDKMEVLTSLENAAIAKY